MGVTPPPRKIGKLPPRNHHLTSKGTWVKHATHNYQKKPKLRSKKPNKLTYQPEMKKKSDQITPTLKTTNRVNETKKKQSVGGRGRADQQKKNTPKMQ